MKLLYLIIAILFHFSIAFSQVRIVTHNGEKYYGLVSAGDSESVTILKKDGFRQVVQIDRIRDLEELEAEIITNDSLIYTCHIFMVDSDSIYYHYGKRNKEMGMARNKIMEIRYSTETDVPITTDIDSIGYSSFGFALGTPGVFNLVYSYRIPNSISIGLEAGGMTNIYGFQLNLGFNLSRSNSFEHNFLLSMGFSSLYNRYDILYNSCYDLYEYRGRRDWTYIGVCYNINLWGFYAEVGLSVGDGDFDSPLPLLQFGYVYRFTD